MIEKDFPSMAELERVKFENDNYKLYSADQPSEDTDRWRWRLKEFFENDKQKAQILDRLDHICPGIVNGTTDFLFGEPVKIKVDSEDKELQKAVDAIISRNSLQKKFSQSAALVQSVGHGHFKCYRNEKTEAVIEEVPYDYVYPNWSTVPLGKETENNRIVIYMTGPKDKKYVYVEEWYMEGEKAFVAKSLWEDVSGRTGGQVPLSELDIGVATAATPHLKQPMTMVESTELTQYPFITIHGRKTVKERFAASEFKKIMPLLHEINDRLTQVSVQFLKHLNAKLQIPEGSVLRDPDTGAIVSVNLEVLIARNGDPDAKYITNDNPMIEECFTHLDKLVRKIAKRMQIPDSFLIEDEKGGVESVESLRTRILMFLKKVKFYQTAYEQEIIRMIRVALEIEGKDFKEVPLKVVYDPGLPKDWKEDGTVWGEAFAAGIASKETAVSRFQGIEGAELDKEMKRIDEDEQKIADAAMASMKVPDDEPVIQE
jgi:hypothetical protein